MSDKLPREGEEGGAETTEKVRSLVVICGPEKAISNYTISRVKIAPGREKGSLISRRIKQLLVSKIKNEDQELKEIAKRIPIDEIMRVLPSGSYKVVTERQNG